MASRICGILLITLFIPSGMDFRPHCETTESKLTKNMHESSNRTPHIVDNNESHPVTSQMTEVSDHNKNFNRQRRRRPLARSASNATLVMRDADGKRRIVYYNPKTSQFTNLRDDDTYSSHNNYFNVANRGKRANLAAKVDNDNIVFPGPSKGDSRDLFEPKVPESCKNSLSFCTLTDNYPQSYVDKILQNTALSFEEFNGTDEIEGSEIGQRIDYSDDASLCVSTENIVFPKSAQNKDFKWLFIVNQPKFIQGVRVETCQNENAECAYSQNFPAGYKSQCKQKYIYRKMLAIDNSGEQIVDNFRLPSCCSCVLHSLSLVSKSGFDPTSQSKVVRRRRQNN